MKVLGVLSYHNHVFACAQRIQFHRTHFRDSIAIVKPFMHDTNYVSRDFATLELLELQLPFAFAFGQVSDTIHKKNLLAVSCVFIKQSPLLMLCIL